MVSHLFETNKSKDSKIIKVHSKDFETSPKKQKVKKSKKKEKQSTEEEEPNIAEMEESFESLGNTSTGKATPKGSKKKKTPQQQDDTSSEEERWLEAIESGKLEEVDDELKKIKPKDPKLMTARQRAMYEKNSGDINPTSPTNKSRKSLPSSTMIDGVQANVSSTGHLLLALPNFKIKKGKEKQPLTEEDIERSKMKAQKRKQIADEKREKDKKKTMERLLKKQDSKAVKSTKIRPQKQQVPVISYKNTQDGIFLSFPFNYPLLQEKMGVTPPKKILCGIVGCKNIKRYSCSKTNIPLCSLECYKKNVESVKQMIF